MGSFRGFSSWGGAELRIAFGLVYSSVGGTVHNAVYFMGRHKLFDIRLTGDVKLGNVGIEPTVLRIFSLQPLHFIAQLSVATCYQDIHCTYIFVDGWKDGYR